MPRLTASPGLGTVWCYLEWAPNSRQPMTLIWRRRRSRVHPTVSGAERDFASALTNSATLESARRNTPPRMSWISESLIPACRPCSTARRSSSCLLTVAAIAMLNMNESFADMACGLGGSSPGCRATFRSCINEGSCAQRVVFAIPRALDLVSVRQPKDRPIQDRQDVRDGYLAGGEPT